jgi:hypothetical protein
MFGRKPFVAPVAVYPILRVKHVFMPNASLNLKLFQEVRQVGNAAAAAIPPKSAMVLEKRGLR